MAPYLIIICIVVLYVVLLRAIWKHDKTKKMTAEEELMLAIQCLYLEVPESIADEIKRKAIAALKEAKEAKYEN